MDTTEIRHDSHLSMISYRGQDITDIPPSYEEVTGRPPIMTSCRCSTHVTRFRNVEQTRSIVHCHPAAAVFKLVYTLSYIISKRLGMETALVDNVRIRNIFPDRQNHLGFISKCTSLLISNIGTNTYPESTKR